MQSNRAAADQLLLDIYSSINEPDSIYAVARGHNMTSQLKLYEHEGRWDKALTGYDLLCRRTLPANTSPASSSAQVADRTRNNASDEPSAHGQQGLLTSLQQLGCRHLIEAYWQGQPAILSPGRPPFPPSALQSTPQLACTDMSTEQHGRHRAGTVSSRLSGTLRSSQKGAFLFSLHSLG